MNLLHVTPYYAPAWAYGGTVRAVADLTRALAAAGHTVIVLTTDTLDRKGRIPAPEETLDGAKVIRVRNVTNMARAKLNCSTPVGFGRMARRLIQEYSIDLVHCHELRTIENLYTTKAMRKDLPLVVSPHGTIPYETGRGGLKQLWDFLFAKRLLSRSNQVVALTTNEAVEIKALWARWNVPLRDDQVSVVPNGVFAEEFSLLPPGDLFRRQWELGDGPVVIFLGRLEERKGLQLLIPAFAEATKNIDGARLLIVGPDENMRQVLNALVEKHHLARRAIFTGLLTGKEKIAALAASDLFVLPAVGEGFSIAALEAMACGLPVLLSSDCHFSGVAEAGAGLAVPREQGAFSNALRKLLLDSDLRSSMGRRAYEFVRSGYLWPQVVAQVEQVYHKARAVPEGPQGNSPAL